MRSVLLALICIVALASVTSAQTLYFAVTTKPPADPSFLTPEERDRQDSVKDLRDTRPSALRRDGFLLADSRHAADVTLTVLGRGPDPTDSDYLLVRVQLTAGDYEATILGREDRWGGAALDAYKQVVRWATKERRKELVAKRPKQAKT